MVLMHRRGRVAEQKRAIRAIRAVQAHKSRLSKKGKGNRWQRSVGRKDLVGAMDGPLGLPSKTKAKKSKKAIEHETVVDGPRL
jgi:hypothetical protein